jgi:translocation and assembly module TamB
MTPTASAPKRRRWLLAAFITLLMLLALLTASAATVWWSASTERGSAWLVSMLPGVEVQGGQGTLLGDYSAQRVTVQLPGPRSAQQATPQSTQQPTAENNSNAAILKTAKTASNTLTLTQLGWRGLRVQRAAAPLWLRLSVDSLFASRVDVNLLPSSAVAAAPGSAKPQPPTTLALPMELEVRALRIDELHANALGDQPVRNIAAHLHLSAQAGAEHRLEHLSLGWSTLQISGQARIATQAPLLLHAALGMAQVQGGLAQPAWSAGASLLGPLQEPLLRAQLQMTGVQTAGVQTADVPPKTTSSKHSLTTQVPPTLDARATLYPFAAWPLGEVTAHIQSLNLADFHSAAPTTRITAEAKANTRSAQDAANLYIELSNALPGRFSDGQLPLRQLKLQLTAQTAAKNTTQPLLEVPTFHAELGTQQGAAGHISGQGRWSAQQWSLATTLNVVQPALLDARAPSMQLSGPLALAGQIDEPAKPDGAVKNQSVKPLINPLINPGVNSEQSNVIHIKTELTGQLAAPLGTALRSANQTTTQLRLDASLSPQRIEVRELQAQMGGVSGVGSGATNGPRASLTGLATHTTTDAPWIIQAQGALVEFDPSVWWPGVENSAWRDIQHRLNAQIKVDLTVPVSAPKVVSAEASAPAIEPAAEPATAPAWQDTLAALRGEVLLKINPSLLAGVPVSGEAQLRSAAGRQALAQLKLDVAGNSLRAEGRVSAVLNTDSKNRAASANATPANDTWDVAVNAPALADLSPLFKLMQPAAAASTAKSVASAAGTLTATARATGRWPAMQTTGQINARGLRAGSFSLQQADATWSLGTSATAPFSAQVNVSQVSASNQPAASLESLQLQLTGTGRAHTLALRAASKAQPPAWVTTLLGQNNIAHSAANGLNAAQTTATLQIQGGLIDLAQVDVRTATTSTPISTPTALANPAISTLAGWRGALQQLELRTASTTIALLRSQNVALETVWAQGPARVTIQPARAELLGGAVQWSRIAWQAASPPSGSFAGSAAQIEADAQIEPLRIAPLLAKLQPEFGWGGDLTLTGHVKLRSAPSFSADIVIERSAGDLIVTEELGTRALGLTDLRLGLNVDNGVWSFTQGLAGQTLGVLAGAVVARTTPQASWPAPETPIQGVLELRVADLGTWGTWVPPGWRLGGTLHSSASIGGRFGAPEYTGQVDAEKLSVRNFLQGVNVSDGEAMIRLQGTTARIERFSAKAGSGTVKLEGNASLGDAPQALLKLTADKFQLLGRVDRRIITSGTGQLQIDSKNLALTGQFKVDEGLIDFTQSNAPKLSSDVQVVRTKSGAGSAGNPEPGEAENTAALKTATAAATTASTERSTALDLRVALGDQLRLRGRGLDTALGGELRITSPGGKLAVNGVVKAVDGTYAAYGQKLTIDRGLIIFSGAVDNPRLDIEATRPNTDLRVGVAVSGNATNPYVRLFSEPALSEIDKLSWLVMGRASDGLGRTETALLQRAALALLAGEGGGLTDQFTKAIGLDDLSVRQSDGEVRDTVISLGKQISRRWYLGYERGLNATTGSFQLIYRIAQRFTLRAQSGLDNSMDVIWTWRWQ